MLTLTIHIWSSDRMSESERYQNCQQKSNNRVTECRNPISERSAKLESLACYAAASEHHSLIMKEVDVLSYIGKKKKIYFKKPKISMEMEHCGATRRLWVFKSCWTRTGHASERNTGWLISALTWQRAHGERVLLINGAQAISADGVSDELELLWQRLTAVGHTDVWDVGTADVVALRTFLIIGGT